MIPQRVAERYMLTGMLSGDYRHRQGIAGMPDRGSSAPQDSALLLATVRLLHYQLT